MRAARYYGNKDIRVEDIEAPEPSGDGVLIDVAWCGICGSDLHEYLDGPIFAPKPGHPNPIAQEELPITLGHEMSGVVREVGPDVKEDLKPGDHVVVEPYLIHREHWDDENYHLSPDMNFIGLGGGPGGLAEQTVVPSHWVHKISDSISLDEAALIEPLSVAHHAVVRSGAKAGDTAIIGGAGPIGVLTAAVLKAIGCTVVVSELSELRRAKALETGVADYAFSPKEVDVAEEVRKLTDGRGADVGFEATSVDVVLDMLFDAVRTNAVIVNESIWGHKPTVDLHKLVMKEIDLRGTIAYVRDHAETIKLVESGKIDLKPFITGKIGLEGIVDEGFDTLINRNETAVKILVSPSGEGL